ncbi:MAG TPA: hypothetical protein VKY26_05890, partial [Actinomycetota bacterium]|nr:hypothetical protein [Actinomycetota bacterium]
TGPVTLRSPVSAALTGTPVNWADAPSSLQVTSPEADFSWAGTGSITTGSGPVQAGYLGVRAQQLSAALLRAGGQVQVQGTGLALGVYANGVPQIKIQARFDVLSTDAVTGFLGLKNAFTWTPRNLDSTYDMAILSIHPGNAAARNVHLGLLALPPMFGGEPHAAVGGDTSGLKGGQPIDSLIARNGDDKRSIGYDGSAGVTIVLIVQGNFDPITVTIHTS